jgi:hypothetical protein
MDERRPIDHVVAGGSAVVVGAARLVPLPLVDDWIASLSRRQLVRSLLRRHGRAFPVSELAPLYDDGSIFGLPFRMAKNLLLFPVRKVLKPLLPFLLARDIALAVGRTIALGHVLDRQLRLGMFAEQDGKKARREQARRLRAALDGAWSGVDRRLVQSAVSVAWQKARSQPAPELEGLFAEVDLRVDRLLAELPP